MVTILIEHLLKSPFRFQFSKNTSLTPEEAEKHGIKMKKPGEVTLEKELEKIKDMDINNWENKRGPRPWEEAEKLKQ